MFRISRFAEVLKLLPRKLFDESVRRHEADKYRKRCSSWQQLVAMLYGQVSGASSLRVLEQAFNAQAGHHYHLGCASIRRSSLAEMNAHAPLEVFSDVAQALMEQAGGTLRREGNEVLRLIDSTSITLKGLGFDEWTGTRTRSPQGGVKLHVLLGTHLPLSHALTASNVNDLEYGRSLPLEKRVIYVFDKAYCDYTWWWRIQCSGARFVTRFKHNAKLAVVHERRIARNAQGVILADQIVRFNNPHPGAGRKNPYCLPLRRIEVARDDQPPLVLATNDLKSSALQIAARYRARWQIELFFKWIKQHLKIKRFFGRSERAVRIQILTALIAYLILALYAKLHQVKKSLWLLLSELRSTLFQRADSELYRHRRWRIQRTFFHSRQTELFA